MKNPQNIPEEAKLFEARKNNEEITRADLVKDWIKNRVSWY